MAEIWGANAVRASQEDNAVDHSGTPGALPMYLFRYGRQRQSLHLEASDGSLPSGVISKNQFAQACVRFMQWSACESGDIIRVMVTQPKFFRLPNVMKYTSCKTTRSKRCI